MSPPAYRSREVVLAAAGSAHADERPARYRRSWSRRQPSCSQESRMVVCACCSAWQCRRRRASARRSRRSCADPDRLRRERGRFQKIRPTWETKMNCLQKGFRWVISPRSATGTDEEQAKSEIGQEDVDVALFLGAPMIRIFTDLGRSRGPAARDGKLSGDCRLRRAKGNFVGLQNHLQRTRCVEFSKKRTAPTLRFCSTRSVEGRADGQRRRSHAGRPSALRLYPGDGATQRTCAPSLRSIRAGRNISTTIELCRCSSTPAITTADGRI